MEIRSNGSKWLGQPPDSIETLIAVLGRETLDPTFEHYGNFFYPRQRNPRTGVPAKFHAFGNFLTVSHVFDITGTLEELRPVARAIRANQRTLAYVQARH